MQAFYLVVVCTLTGPRFCEVREGSWPYHRALQLHLQDVLFVLCMLLPKGTKGKSRWLPIVIEYMRLSACKEINHYFRLFVSTSQLLLFDISSAS